MNEGKHYGIMAVTKDAILGKLEYVDDAEQKRRIAICEQCPHFTKLRTCDLCGCIMDLKTKLAKASCPINKWGPVTK